MILLVRLDDRLLHGQVALSLKSYVDYNVVVICDDLVAKDELRKEALKLCKPSDVRMSIRGLFNTIEILNDIRMKDKKILILVNNPKTAYELYQKLAVNNDKLPDLNLGGMQKNDSRKMISKALYMNDEEVDYINKIKDMNVDVKIFMTPNEEILKWENLSK